MESDAVDKFSSSLVLVMFTRQRTCQNSHVLPYCCVQHNMANNKCGIFHSRHHHPCSSFSPFSHILIILMLVPAACQRCYRLSCSLQPPRHASRKKGARNEHELWTLGERGLLIIYFSILTIIALCFLNFFRSACALFKTHFEDFIVMWWRKKVGELEKEPPKGDYVEVLITSSSTRLVHFFCALFSFWLANLLTFTRV